MNQNSISYNINQPQYLNAYAQLFVKGFDDFKSHPLSIKFKKKFYPKKTVPLCDESFNPYLHSHEYASAYPAIIEDLIMQ
jgi:hypothetical protein